jgi:hypothetical protein
MIVLSVLVTFAAFCSNLRAGHPRKEPELPACGSISHHRILIGSACPSKNGNTEEIQQKDAKIAKTESTLGAESKLGAAICKGRDLIGMNHLQEAILIQQINVAPEHNPFNVRYRARISIRGCDDERDKRIGSQRAV